MPPRGGEATEPERDARARRATRTFTLLTGLHACAGVECAYFLSNVRELNLCRLVALLGQLCAPPVRLTRRGSRERSRAEWTLSDDAHHRPPGRRVALAAHASCSTTVLGDAPRRATMRPAHEARVVAQRPPSSSPSSPPPPLPSSRSRQSSHAAGNGARRPCALRRRRRCRPPSAHSAQFERALAERRSRHRGQVASTTTAPVAEAEMDPPACDCRSRAPHAPVAGAGWPVAAHRHRHPERRLGVVGARVCSSTQTTRSPAFQTRAGRSAPGIARTAADVWMERAAWPRRRRTANNNPARGAGLGGATAMAVSGAAPEPRRRTDPPSRSRRPKAMARGDGISRGPLLFATALARLARSLVQIMRISDHRFITAHGAVGESVSGACRPREWW